MRWVLLAATVLLAALVLVASPVTEHVLALLGPPPPPPLVVSAERPCGPQPTDPWMAALGEVLEDWIVAARTVATDEAEAGRLAESARRLTTGPAEATLAAFFKLRSAERISPAARSAVYVDEVSTRFCPGATPVWEITWTELGGDAAEDAAGSPAGNPADGLGSRWVAVVGIAELPFSPELHLAHPEGFLITDFDWGRVPGSSGAVPAAPPSTVGESRP